jgi:hypothetical protein
VGVKRILTALLAAGALVALPASASADVLVDQGPRSIACGDDIEMAVWYQSYSGGPHWAILTVKSIDGRMLAQRRVTATTTWRSYHYTPSCGRRYRVLYTVPGGRLAYTVRVGY